MVITRDDLPAVCRPSYDALLLMGRGHDEAVLEALEHAAVDQGPRPEREPRPEGPATSALRAALVRIDPAAAQDAPQDLVERLGRALFPEHDEHEE